MSTLSYRIISEMKEYKSRQPVHTHLNRMGCSERKNRYLTEMTRSMLFGASLPNKYWGEALLSANHLQNRMPTGGDISTPYEKWTGRKPKLDYLRQFGASAYMMIPAEKRRKLDEKARKLVFVGYPTGTKGYRLLDTATDRIYISRDVIFIEKDPHVTPTTADEQKPELTLDAIEPEESVKIPLEDTTKVSKNTGDNLQINGEPVRRSTRANRGKPPERLIEVVNKVTCEALEPKSYSEALTTSDAQHWQQAINEEMESLRHNETWTLTKLPEGKTAVGSKWVFKIKTDETGNVTRYKARLVAQGYSQTYGCDYDEVFAPVAKPITLRLLLTIAGHEGMFVKHYDIQSAYLNGDLSHEVYMKQPEGYEASNKELVCKLNKNLYGLKQGAIEWNRKLHEILTKEGYNQSRNDLCLYSKQQNGKWLYISTHVDDLIVVSADSQMIKDFEEKISKTVIMKNLGNLQHYVGLQFERDEHGIFSVHQRKYIDEKLREFNLTDSKPSKIPRNTGYQKNQMASEEMKSKEVYRSAIGSLQYLAVNTRPDIAVAVSILARHVESPRVKDWTEVKRIFRYLKFTKDKKLKLGSAEKASNRQLFCYADADWGSDIQDRKSNSGYCFQFLNSTIMWSSRKQSMVTLSSTEAEYIALAEALKEAVWIRRILEDLNQVVVGPTVVYEDNQSCIRLITDERSSVGCATIY
jgi:hypothetical protein